MDHFISMYIDNELSLDEKVVFIKYIHGNKAYTDETISMLEQEKVLSAALNHSAPEIALPRSYSSRPIHSVALAVAACLLLVMSFMAGANFTPLHMPASDTAAMAATVQHRFVILQQGAAKVEIAGSFTQWQKVPLTPTGSENYWEITLEVPYGEHRYAFIVDGTELLPDPTVTTREADDFGSMNSVINLES